MPIPPLAVTAWTGTRKRPNFALKIIGLEGKDACDRLLSNDIGKRVGKSLKLLRTQGVATSDGRGSNLVWALTTT